MFTKNLTAKLSLSAIALVALGSAASAEVLSPGSDSFAEVGKSGPWTIFADAQRQSCLIEGSDASGNVVQMGLTSGHNLGYVGVFTQADVGLADGAMKDITIEVNGNLYSGAVKLREHGLSDGYQGGYFVANNPNFLADLKAGKSLVAFADASGKGVMVDLTGSDKALEAAAECTAQLQAM